MNAESYVFMNAIVGREIIQLSNNFIPRELVPLEILFDSNDVAVKPRIQPSDNELEDYNFGRH